VTHLLRDEYRIKQVTKVSANSLEELVLKLTDVDVKRALTTISDFNDSIDDSIPFNPNIKDGRATNGLNIPKSNWANKLDAPPFEAYAITCGVTFTFGGLRVSTDAQVMDVDLKPIPGLYAAGEIIGGIFYNNYPGGSGLMSGSVFGKIAGESASRA